MKGPDGKAIKDLVPVRFMLRGASRFLFCSAYVEQWEAMRPGDPMPYSELIDLWARDEMARRARRKAGVADLGDDELADLFEGSARDYREKSWGWRLDQDRDDRLRRHFLRNWRSARAVAEKAARSEAESKGLADAIARSGPPHGEG